MVLGGRRQDRVGARLAFGEENMAAFGQAPAVIAPLLDQVNLLPEILTVLADPELARLAVEAEPPGIAQAVGPELGTGAGAIDEGIVAGHAVVPARVGVIDVDPQHGRQQVVQGLPRHVGVRAAGTVSRRDVKEAVVAEGKVAAVVAVGGPLDDHLLRIRADPMWRPGGQPCSERPASPCRGLSRGRSGRCRHIRFARNPGETPGRPPGRRSAGASGCRPFADRRRWPADDPARPRN